MPSMTVPQTFMMTRTILWDARCWDDGAHAWYINPQKINEILVILEATGAYTWYVVDTLGTTVGSGVDLLLRDPITDV
jgi:hypothetical protein